MWFQVKKTDRQEFHWWKNPTYASYKLFHGLKIYPFHVMYYHKVLLAFQVGFRHCLCRQIPVKSIPFDEAFQPPSWMLVSSLFIANSTGILNQVLNPIQVFKRKMKLESESKLIFLLYYMRTFFISEQIFFCLFSFSKLKLEHLEALSKI